VWEDGKRQKLKAGFSGVARSEAHE
jgi:hypothetical protein